MASLPAASRSSQAGSHSHGGDDLIAAGQHDQAVQTLALGHDLHTVGNQVAGRQHEAHTLVALSLAVAQGDGVELEGLAPRGDDTLLHGGGQLPQVFVAGMHLVPGVDDADEGLFDLLLAHAQGVQQGAVARTDNALGHLLVAQLFDFFTHVDILLISGVHSHCVVFILPLHSSEVKHIIIVVSSIKIEDKRGM